jgi:serine phosphatase RsbU (regulator of sigma subunit)
MKITKASDNQIDTIDDLPILQIYEKYFGNDIQNDFFRKVMSFPLLIKRNGIWLARIPNQKTEDGALRFGADVYADEIVQFGFGNIDKIVATSANITQKIAKQMPETVFVYSCATRLYFMQKSIELETMPLQNVATTTGFFTFGEYFYGTNSNEILNMTMTILTLSECPKAKEYTTLLEDTNQIHAENKNEYTEILSLLTHLVNTVTEELKEKNIAIDNSLSQLQESYEEINQMNEELQATIDLVTSQKEEIETQRDKIEKHNYDITSSINYAKRIQQAILPSREEIAMFLPNNFIFFRPRDVVSGDFYWFGVRGNKIVFAVIDCTGHGVPGAFMTLIANDLLNQIILEKGVCEPNKILNELHIRVRKSLRQSENDVSDGMEIAICTIDKWAKKVQYAGAKMDLYWTQNGECHTTQSDNYPIGGEQREFKREFTLKEIDITAPTTIYMSSDGYKDQFGGRHNKRFMSKNFRNLLFSLVDLPMEVQGEYLDQTITEWMGYHNRQIDDILVVGIKV